MGRPGVAIKPFPHSEQVETMSHHTPAVTAYPESPSVKHPVPHMTTCSDVRGQRNFTTCVTQPKDAIMAGALLSYRSYKDRQVWDNFPHVTQIHERSNGIMVNRSKASEHDRLVNPREGAPTMQYKLRVGHAQDPVGTHVPASTGRGQRAFRLKA